MTTAIDLLRARLAWVQEQISKELARKDSDSRQQLITAGRIDVFVMEEMWFLDAIQELEAEQEAGSQ